MSDLLKGLKLDCEKVIKNLVANKCDDAWSIIKLNNMISDIDDCLDKINPNCRTCSGTGEIFDVNDNRWQCPECNGRGY